MSIVVPFKICPMCKKTWIDENEFFTDANIVFLGVQNKTGEDGKQSPHLNLFFHRIKDCGTTLALEIK